MKDTAFPRLRFHKRDGSHRRPGDTDVTSANVSKKLAKRRKEFDAHKAHGTDRGGRSIYLLDGNNLPRRCAHRPGSLK